MTQDDKGSLGIRELYTQFSSMPYTPRKYSGHGKFKLDPELNAVHHKFTLDPLYHGQVSYEFVADPVFNRSSE
jgi:hypothetical protein